MSNRIKINQLVISKKADMVVFMLCRFSQDYTVFYGQKLPKKWRGKVQALHRTHTPHPQLAKIVAASRKIGQKWEYASFNAKMNSAFNKIIPAIADMPSCVSEDAIFPKPTKYTVTGSIRGNDD